MKFTKASQLILLAQKFKDLWIEPDAFLRYLPVIRWLKKHESSKPKVLEVGSGDFGISTYISYPVTKLDRRFTHTKKEKNKIQGDASNLPFQKRSFDLVFCVDFLEHIKPEKRFDLLKEMVRVSKKEIILIFPAREKARQQDFHLMKFYEQATGKLLPILKAHEEFLFPETSEINDWLFQMKKLGCETKTKNLFNLKLRKKLLKGWLGQNKLAIKIAGLLIQFPILGEFMNFGNCYRKIIFISLPNFRPASQSNHPDALFRAEHRQTLVSPSEGRRAPIHSDPQSLHK